MIDTAPAWGTETWRGNVVAWQCDEMGHQNARFYASQAIEGLNEYCLSLQIGSIDQIDVNELVIKFLRELRAGTPIHLQSAVIECDPSTALFAHSLHDSISGECAATMIVRLSCRDIATNESKSWPSKFFENAINALTALPDNGSLRGLPPLPSARSPTLQRADALGLATTGRGVIGGQECDTDGRLHTKEFTARFSDATRLYITHFHRAVADALPEPRRIGSAAVETRQTYFGHPRINDRFVIKTGLVSFDEKSRLVEYWMLDPVSGQPWARLESVELLLDLDTRRTFSLSQGALIALRPLLNSL